MEGDLQIGSGSESARPPLACFGFGFGCSAVLLGLSVTGCCSAVCLSFCTGPGGPGAALPPGCPSKGSMGISSPIFFSFFLTFSFLT